MTTTEFVFIGAEWCQPCKRTYPAFQRVLTAEGLEHTYLDVDTALGVSRVANVYSVPTIRAHVDGELVAEHRGGASEAALRAFVRGAL